MLEWMHDFSVVEFMQANFMEKTLEDCASFIDAAQSTAENLHMAIVDDNDIYMGTVSLKHIAEDTAEFAITVRKCAMGKGFANFGMREVLRIGFEDLGLAQIYWSVNPKSAQASRFYEKHGYQKVDAARLKIKGDYTEEQIRAYKWYLEEK